jgi:predicted metal-dependent phosphoesterase TrpH
LTLELHCHSTASDGALAPAALVEHAHALGIGTLALTDHDTLAGLGEAAGAAARLGLRFVAGAEISVRPPSGSMHLLAYLPSAEAEPLATRIQAIADYRGSRNQRMVARLNELGYALEWDDVARRAKGRVGRPHIAAALVDAGHVGSLQEAFDRLLADGQPAYVDAGSLGPEEAVEVVAASGGAPVLAHPYSLRMGDAELERFVARLAACGLRGVECYRPDHDAGQRAFTLRLCARAGLVPTGGCDWHGRPDDPPLGHAGPVPVPEDTLERLGLCMSTPSC